MEVTVGKVVTMPPMRIRGRVFLTSNRMLMQTAESARYEKTTNRKKASAEIDFILAGI